MELLEVTLKEASLIIFLRNKLPLTKGINSFFSLTRLQRINFRETNSVLI